MLYINQLEYPDIPYPTHVNDPNHERNEGSVKSAGCGLCSACMMVDRLTMESLSLIECRDLAVETVANWESGTDMTILGPAVAEKFGLELKQSNNIEELIACLEEGGCAILNPGGDYPGHVGIFTKGGHYIVAIDFKDGEFTILDPSLHEGKFDIEGRKGTVRVDGNFCYAKPEIIAAECANRDPGYYLFKRK